MLLAAAANAGAICQTVQNAEKPKYEVASIKPHKRGDNHAFIQASYGRLVITNFSLKQLILIAYDTSNNRLSGIQPWMDSNHFDIQAKTESSATVKQLEGPMLQMLLEERFQLKVHREMMERPVYELSVDRSGVKMQLSKKGSCIPYLVESPPPSPGSNSPRPIYCDSPHFAGDGLNWTMDGKGVSIGTLVASLTRSGLGRPIIDRTGLTGRFDLHLKWTADMPDEPEGYRAKPDPTGSSIFTALKEQLGLKLKSAKDPIGILIIDHAESPSGN